MAQVRFLLYAGASALAVVGALPAQTALNPQTINEFECYVQSAEARMAARKTFLLAESDAALNTELVNGKKIVLNAVPGANPKKMTGTMLYDWTGSVFLPGATLERTIRMLQDYDHRPQYFGDVVASSKLNCRSGEGRFGYSMRLKEPAVIDSDYDVVWEKVDARRWKCRSFSTKVREVEKQRGYLLRLCTYWRIAANDQGVYVESEAIELSGQFGSVTRALGSMFMGISPEKSLRRTLNSIREVIQKPGDFALPPVGLPECGPVYKPAGCGGNGLRGKP
jgi:hypothetical protein